jgi:hypothetical protein
MKYFLSVLILVLAGLVPLQAQQFTFLFTVHDAGGVGDTLEFGVSPAATFCEDQALLELNNAGPPPFPFMFTWVNPRSSNWLGDDNDCFMTGRMRYGRMHKLDLRPFTSTAQVDTYRVKFYSFDAGHPFHFSWQNLTHDKCDSMKLTYTLGGSPVEVDMFATSVDTIYDPNVTDVYIITYGAKGISTPLLLSPVNHQANVSRFARLNWTPLPFEATYEVELSADSLFTTTLYEDTLQGTSYRTELLDPLTTYFWHIRTVAPGNPSPWSDAWSFRTIGEYYDYAVGPRWNLVSVPLLVTDPRPPTLFGAALSSAFQYLPGGGYATADTLVPGRGYWMKFPSAFDYRMVGKAILADTMPLVAGWNLIGSVNDTIPVEDLSTNPPGMIRSVFYGYSGGLSVAQEIFAAHGYWVLASGEGEIILSGGAPGARKANPALRSALAALGGLSALEFADTAGCRQRLYFGDRPADLTPSWSFEMPPRPAPGMFDVRFSTQSIAEFSAAAALRTAPILVSSDAFPVTVRWEGGAPGAFLAVGSRSYSLAAPGSAPVLNAKTAVSLRFGAGHPGGEPERFSVAQNYPNPFNPQTVISYTLPSETRVKIAVYNILGEQVAVLVDEMEGPGAHEATYVPADLPSGAYVYRVSAGAETIVRKMLYVK